LNQRLQPTVVSENGGTKVDRGHWTDVGDA
jgi:hypothetical protein